MVEELFADHHDELFHKTNRFKKVVSDLRYEGKACAGKNLREAQSMIGYFDRELKNHVEIEEKTLFPYLGTHIPKLESLLLLLRSEHQDIKERIRQFRKLLVAYSKVRNAKNRQRASGEIQETGLYLIYLLRSHLEMESKSIYGTLTCELRAGEKQELNEMMVKRIGSIKRRRRMVWSAKKK